MKDANSGYPMISANNWWTIRNKFKASLPNKVTADYFVSLLGLKDAKSAQSNVVTPLRRLGLLDEEGNTTDLAKKWRIDTSYKEACAEMLERVYPSELLSLVTEGDFDKQIANNWFMTQGVGEAAARKMTSLLSMLKNGGISAEDNRSTKKKSSSNARTKKTTAKPTKRNSEDSLTPNQSTTDNSELLGLKSSPNLHIDLQIHISPDSSPEQIEAIFSSMSKHLYRNES